MLFIMFYVNVFIIYKPGFFIAYPLHCILYIASDNIYSFFIFAIIESNVVSVSLPNACWDFENRQRSFRWFR